MQVIGIAELKAALEPREVIARMREATAAFSRGECEMPMPMHLAIPPERAEVHIKSSYRRGGKYFALKIAGTFPENQTRGLSNSAGMMLLSSAETGAPVAFFRDNGYLTDARTAAVAAMVAQDLGRDDDTLGILGSGVQARLTAEWHAAVLPLRRVIVWGRRAANASACARDIARKLPGIEVTVAASPAAVARESRLIVTATAARFPFLHFADLQPGTHISAVGADSVGKQELDPAILRGAELLLVDSHRQCRVLGELQHAPDQFDRAFEIGAWDRTPPPGLSVCDFTGLGAEDLYIAEYCFERLIR
jgi:ornithine cyclodeaminase